MNNSAYLPQSRSQGTWVVLSVNIIKKQSSLYWHIYIGKTIDNRWEEKSVRVPLSQGPASLVLVLIGATAITQCYVPSAVLSALYVSTPMWVLPALLLAFSLGWSQLESKGRGREPIRVLWHKARQRGATSVSGGGKWGYPAHLNLYS